MCMKKYMRLIGFVCTVILIIGCCVTAVNASESYVGDMDGNLSVSSDDAILLLRHTLAPTVFPVVRGGDMDANGSVNSDDAVYLLRHVLLPDDYPLNNPRPDLSIEVEEDTYVFNHNGTEDQSDNNFGTDTEIHIKSDGDTLTRYSYLKFDISSLKAIDDYACIELDLTITTKQNGSADYSTVELYECMNNWSEENLTFNSVPEYYGLVCTNSTVSTATKVHRFPVTDCVRQALADGRTEISFYLKEATEGSPRHTRFASKEHATANAPTLSVYFDIKGDRDEYDKHNADPEISENGLDKILGLNRVTADVVEVTEDTYVEAGTSANTNFGSATILDLKAWPGSATAYYRVPLLKFDISKLSDETISSALLVLECTSMQDTTKPTQVNIYTCDPDVWEETSVTYNSIPDKGELVTEGWVTGKGIVFLDITDYIISCRDLGKQEIALRLEGDTGSVYHLQFASSNSDGSAPNIRVTYRDTTFTTLIRYENENPWAVAMDAVTEWLERWEEIKKGGDSATETIVKDSAEYSLTVDAATVANTNGYNTVYTKYPTRNISTLKGYTANTSETSKYDVYGGLMDETLRQEATGFFYTKKVGDRWWTFDPLGYPFFRTAVVSVTIGNDTQKARMIEKYGNTSTWAQATTDRLFELGFNSAGGWSIIDTLIKTDNPISQTKIISLVSSYASTLNLNISKSGSTDLVGGVLPVFDPDFVGFVDTKVESTVSQYADSPNVYGWMSDNELPDGANMLDSSLVFDIKDSRFIYSYATAWTFMYMKTGKEDVSVMDITDELRKEYRAMVYDKYFSVTCAALDKHAPNHQFMGCRFLAGCYKNEYVLRVAGYWCDVITLNYYGAWEGDPTIIANIQKYAGKPFVVTEWYAKGMDVWEEDNRMTNKSGAGWTVRTQADRGKFYQNYALMLLECKGCVGFDWFKYWDNDPDDTSADLSNRNANKGIVDNYGEEYTALTDYMKELNSQKYNLIKFFDAR